MSRYYSYDSDWGEIGAKFIIILIILGLCAGCSLMNRKTETHKILSIDKVEQTVGDSDGFNTVVYYLVTTDKGAYKVVMSGFNAAPQCAGLKKDSTYVLTTRGVRIPFFGYYPNIIEAR